MHHSNVPTCLVRLFLRLAAPCIVAAWSLVCVTRGGAAETPKIWRFDFGTDSSPLQAGYLRVTKDSSYREDRGFGWLEVPPVSQRIPANPTGKPGQIAGLFDRDREIGSALSRDFVMASTVYHPLTKHSFAVKIPAGAYQIALLVGDGKHFCGTFTIRAAGGTSQSMTAAKPGVFRIFTLDAKVSGKPLEITFESPKLWSVNAILVYPATMAEDIREREKSFFSSL